MSASKAGGPERDGRGLLDCGELAFDDFSIFGVQLGEQPSARLGVSFTGRAAPPGTGGHAARTPMGATLPHIGCVLLGQGVQDLNVVDYDERVAQKLVSDLREEGINPIGGINDHHDERCVFHQ